METTKTVWIVAGIVILFSLILMPFGNRWGGMMGMMYPSYSSYGYSGLMGFGWAFMLLVIVALVLLISWLAQQLQHKDRK